MMREDLMVQQQVENLWQYFVGVLFKPKQEECK